VTPTARSTTFSRATASATPAPEVLVEEFMQGEEISLFAITDGRTFVVLPGLQDHKRLLPNDLGPNTGGMGAYLPVQLGYDADRSLSAEPEAADELALGRPATYSADAAGAGRPWTQLHRAALRGPHAHADRPESGRVQLPGSGTPRRRR
jgi:hypothetical protein